MTGHHPKRQADALSAAGAGIVYTIGDDGCATWREFVAATRRGDTVMIEALTLLAEPKSKAVRWPSQDLRDAIEEIERRGAVILETHTGRRSDDPDERRAMIADAVRALGAGQRALPSAVASANGKKGGRRPKVFDAAAIDKARRVWESRKYKTYREATAALPPGFSMSRAFRMFGPRG